ncbi:MAG TPA: metal-dependent hydrolase [Bacillota bacterium]|nr:metal-dependent hydrolase [Bacillota bacterium]
MDTGTHIVMGVAIGGLATLDPVVANDPTLFNAVLAGTIIGSQAPDADTILKFKNNATYIRNHRGLTHSIPAVFLWGMIIPLLIYLIVPEVSFLNLWLWTTLAVILHVVVDIFNAYGTQAIRPISKKWVALGFINTFDPYIFTMHIVGIVAWLLGANPGFTWLIIYGVIILYYIKRYIDKREIVQTLNKHFDHVEKISTSPTMKQNNWRITVTTTDMFYVGTVKDGHIEIVDQFYRVPLPDTKMINQAKRDKNIAAFLSFSPVFRWEVSEYNHFFEVRFIDLRYRSKGYYPFVAVVHLDKEMNAINSYTGWIFSEQKLQNKLLFGDAPI